MGGGRGIKVTCLDFSVPVVCPVTVVRTAYMPPDWWDEKHDASDHVQTHMAWL